jgi:hypothetical protein
MPSFRQVINETQTTEIPEHSGAIAPLHTRSKPSEQTRAACGPFLTANGASLFRDIRVGRRWLLLRKARVRLHFQHLLGVPLAVRRDQQHPLVSIQLHAHRTIGSVRA